jgi:hypothetical protein
MNIVELKPQLDCEGIAKALRAIADDVEAGAYDFDPTLAVVVLGAEIERKDRNGITLSFDWQTHGLGKAGFFASKGLLAVAAASFDGPSE